MSPRLHAGGASALEAPSAALVAGGERGQHRRGGLIEASDRDGRLLALFGLRPAIRGSRCVSRGSLDERILPLVRPLDGSPIVTDS